MSKEPTSTVPVPQQPTMSAEERGQIFNSFCGQVQRQLAKQFGEQMHFSLIAYPRPQTPDDNPNILWNSTLPPDAFVQSTIGLLQEVEKQQQAVEDAQWSEESPDEEPNNSTPVRNKAGKKKAVSKKRQVRRVNRKKAPSTRNRKTA